jgi:ufm1-conjugating enzyme 1
MVDEVTRKSLSGIPLLKTKAGPRDKELWVQRLKEEFQALIKYVETNKQQDNDWFRLESNKEGTRWFGKCWYIQDLLKYEFDVEFDVSCIIFIFLFLINYDVAVQISTNNKRVVTFTMY